MDVLLRSGKVIDLDDNVYTGGADTRIFFLFKRFSLKSSVFLFIYFLLIYSRISALCLPCTPQEEQGKQAEAVFIIHNDPGSVI